MRYMRQKDRSSSLIEQLVSSNNSMTKFEFRNAAANDQQNQAEEVDEKVVLMDQKTARMLSKKKQIQTPCSKAYEGRFQTI